MKAPDDAWATLRELLPYSVAEILAARLARAKARRESAQPELRLNIARGDVTGGKLNPDEFTPREPSKDRS